MDSRLLYLSLGAFAGSVESALIVVVLPAIAEETGVSIAQAGLLVFTYSLAYGFGTPILSTLLGGVHRRAIVAGAEFVFGVGTLLVGLLPGFALVLIARTFLACGAGLFTATAQSTAVALAAPGQRGRAVSTVVFGGTVAVAAGVPLATLIANLYGWRVAYVGLGVVAIAAAATMRLMLPGNIPGDRRTLRERLSVLRVPGVPLTLLVSGLVLFSMFMPMTYLAPLTTEAIGLPVEAMPLVMLAFGIGAVFGNAAAGYFADRIGARLTMLLMLGAIVVLMAALPLLAWLPEGARHASFYGCMVVFGVLTWGFFPAQLLRLAGIVHHSLPLAASINLTTMNIGGALAAVVGGLAYEQAGLAGVGWGAAAIAIVAFAIAISVRDRPA